MVRTEGVSLPWPRPPDTARRLPLPSRAGAPKKPSPNPSLNPSWNQGAQVRGRNGLPDLPALNLEKVRANRALEQAELASLLLPLAPRAHSARSTSDAKKQAGLTPRGRGSSSGGGGGSGAFTERSSVPRTPSEHRKALRQDAPKSSRGGGNPSAPHGNPECLSERIHPRPRPHPESTKKSASRTAASSHTSSLAGNLSERHHKGFSTEVSGISKAAKSNRDVINEKIASQPVRHAGENVVVTRIKTDLAVSMARNPTLQTCFSRESVKEARVSKEATNQSAGPMNFIKLKVRDNLSTNQRVSEQLKVTVSEDNKKDGTCTKESKSYKVRPLKLSTCNTHTSVPLGYGSQPVENVQTSRASQPPGEVASPRLVYTDRGVSRRDSMRVCSSKHEVTGASHNPILSHGVPMTPETIMKKFGACLTQYEHNEIKHYSELFFLGTEGQKIQATTKTNACNFGFDDERGDYNIVKHDHIAYRYEILNILGKGSFGQVAKCHDYKYKVLRAVKIVRNKKRFHQQALVEVKILQHLREKAGEEPNNYNVVMMHETFYFRGHLCISFALHDISLYELLRRNKFQGLSLHIIKSFATQLLTTLKFLRKLRIIHCDLKPENILLQNSSMTKIKVIDFGSSCFDNEKIYTYIQSRFYRSPEVILGLPYDMMIDIWSLGCILAELYTGYPLFPGENEVEQLACMMEVLGLPPSSILEQATRKKMFFDSNNSPRIVANSWGKKHWPGTKDLAIAIGCSDTLFVSFLEWCLRWDKNVRAVPDELLKHPWIVGDSAGVHRLPLQNLSHNTSKQRCIKLTASETAPRSSKQSKQTFLSLQKSNETMLQQSASAKANNHTMLPTIAETSVLKDLLPKKKNNKN